MTVKPVVLKNGRQAETVLWILVVIAIVHQAVNQVRPKFFTVDEIAQYVAGQSWLQGLSCSLVYAAPAQLSQPLVQPLEGRPPGISIVFASAWWLMKDPASALFAVKTFATVLFFAAWWFILWTLRHRIGFVPRALVFGWWAFAASPLQALPASDSLALALFTAGIAANLFVLRRGNGSIEAAFGGGLLIASAAAVRYAYWPLVAVPPASLAMVMRGQQRKGLVKLALLELSVSAAFMVASAVYKYETAGAVTNFEQKWPGRVRGFYPGQLKRLDPFPSGAVGIKGDLIYYWYLKYKKAFGGKAQLSSADWLLWLISISVLAAAILGARRYAPDLRPVGGAGLSDSKTAFLLLTAAASLTCTIGMLAALSLRLPPDSENWVFLEEFRYYAPAFMMIYLGCGGALADVCTIIRARPRLRPLAALAAGLVVLPTMFYRARNSFHDVRHVVSGYRPDEVSLWQMQDTLQREIARLSRAGWQVVYADPSEQRLLVGAMAGARMIKTTTGSDISLDGLDRVAIIAGIPFQSGGAGWQALRSELLRRGAVSLGQSGGVELLRLAERQNGAQLSGASTTDYAGVRAASAGPPRHAILDARGKA